ncbi:MAG: glycoside hydrolase family 32 protein [Duncaniella sp.]|nr:glycoside hydrolase family 32 protein [Duncaniella sp.]
MRTTILSVFCSIVCTSAFAAQPDDTNLYREPYRPQYHFTPKHRWIGDPCGLVYNEGKYHAYSWGAVESDDLVFWNEINQNSIQNLPKDIAPFTGSVVIDTENTAGYGENAFIAVFTSFDENSKKQSQSIAFSLDGGKTFQYYDQNPVLDIWSTEFRDPSVIWDSENKRWIMAVAKALEKKVAFYGSPDLKHWEWLSDFGPMGDSERSWECPDLFKLKIEGTDQEKWVLLVSVNWAREQYFIGDFNGKEFIAEQTDSYPLYVDEGLDYYASRVFQNYSPTQSDETYTIGWVNTWDYAQQAPTTYGKGIWSLPRKLTLVKTSDGLRLKQLPSEKLRVLRDGKYTFSRRLKPGTVDLKEVSKMHNTYELEVDLSSPSNNDIVGLNLCCGDGRKVAVSYDWASNYLKFDRTNSTDAVLPKFDRIAFAKIKPEDGHVRLNIFVDKSTIEIFAENGLKTFSLLTYPSESQTEAEVFSLRGGSNINLTAYPLKSIH